MNIYAAAVFFVIGCTPPAVFSSDDVAGRKRRRALQAKKTSGGGINTNEDEDAAPLPTCSLDVPCKGNAFCNYGCQYSEVNCGVCMPCPPQENICGLTLFSMSGDISNNGIEACQSTCTFCYDPTGVACQVWGF